MTVSTLEQREQVLLIALKALNIAPVLLPNKAKEMAKPYLVPEYLPVSSRNIGLNPGGKLHTALFVVKVITDLDVFSGVAQRLGQQVMDGFPFGLVMDCGGDKMRVSDEPRSASAIKTDTSWCLPVTIPVMVTGK